MKTLLFFFFYIITVFLQNQGAEDTFYKSLKKLENEGIIRKTDNNEKVQKESKYYPVETTEGFLRLLRYTLKDYRSGFYPVGNRFGLNPAYSKYSEMVLNRQFILDCLRKKAKTIRTIHGKRLVDIPIVGRYSKNYELGPRFRRFVNVLDEVRRLLADTGEKDYRRICDLLLGKDEPLPKNSMDPDYTKITDEKRESNLLMIDKLKQGFELELEFLDYYAEMMDSRTEELRAIREFSDGTSKRFADHLFRLRDEQRWYINAETEINGLSWYRQESTWERMVLDKDDRTRLDTAYPGCSEEYPEWIEERIVMPLLCLAQFSYVALISIAFDKIPGTLDGTVTFSDNNGYRLMPRHVPPKWADEKAIAFMFSNKTFNDYLGTLTKASMGDYTFVLL